MYLTYLRNELKLCDRQIKSLVTVLKCILFIYLNSLIVLTHADNIHVPTGWVNITVTYKILHVGRYLLLLF